MKRYAIVKGVPHEAPEGEFCKAGDVAELCRALVVLAAAATTVRDNEAINVALDTLPNGVKESVRCGGDGSLPKDYAEAKGYATRLVEGLGLAPLETIAGMLTQLDNCIADLRNNQVVTCVYCGHEYPKGTPKEKHALLSAHIRECELHPVAHLTRMLREIQWCSPAGESDIGCPICLQTELQGHSEACRLGILLDPAET